MKLLNDEVPVSFSTLEQLQGQLLLLQRRQDNDRLQFQSALDDRNRELDELRRTLASHRRDRSLGDSPITQARDSVSPSVKSESVGSMSLISITRG